MDIGVLLIAATGFFFVLAACLVIVVISLKTKEATDQVASDIRLLRKDFEQFTATRR